MKGERGIIRHPLKASQQIDYSCVRYGNATPSDIDGILELQDKLFVFFEFKDTSAQPLTGGQRIALQRIADAISKGGKRAIVIIGEHNTPVGQDIRADESLVLEVRWEGRWHDIKNKKLTVKQCTDEACSIALNDNQEQPIFAVHKAAQWNRTLSELIG